jgi:hypothetical protein
MLELSASERRYLAAACSASPLYAFRPRVIGQLASFADGDTDVIVASLRRAGMVETDRESHARLTDRGRSAARGLAVMSGPHGQRSGTLVAAGLALCAVVAIVVVGLLLL